MKVITSGIADHYAQKLGEELGLRPKLRQGQLPQSGTTTAMYIDQAIECGRKLNAINSNLQRRRGDCLGGLEPKEMWAVYCQGDGFGRLTPEQLLQVNDGWDWSHVRDSTPEGIDRMYEELKQWVPRLP